MDVRLLVNQCIGPGCFSSSRLCGCLGLDLIGVVYICVDSHRTAGGENAAIARTHWLGRAGIAQTPRSSRRLPHGCIVQHSTGRVLSVHAAADAASGPRTYFRVDVTRTGDGNARDVLPRWIAYQMETKMDLCGGNGHLCSALFFLRVEPALVAARRRDPPWDVVHVVLYHGPNLSE